MMSLTWWIVGVAAIAVLLSALLSVILFGLVAREVSKLKKRVEELERRAEEGSGDQEG